MLAEVGRSLERCREDARGKAEVRVVGDAQGLVIGIDLDDGGDRAEYLFPVDAHAVARVHEQRRRQIVALSVAVEKLAAPGEFGSLLAPYVEIFEILRELALVDDRADLRSLLEGVVDF